MPYYVTTPIYYVNGEPHLGHAYTTIAADVLARHMRQRGEDVFFLTGTDEHGEPVAQAAEALGITPRELGDRNAVRFRELAATLNVTNDFFIRTTDREHMEKVAEVVQRIHDNGHVYAGHYEGRYCPRCADFKTDSELEDGNRCPIHKIVLEIEQEDNWFFRLSTFQEPLEQLYADRPGFVTPRNRYNEALAFIRSGLRDVSLSRARLKWGVPVPWDDSQVIYVWIDALLNYYTALSYARDGQDLTGEFWPATVQLVGKDILKFHAIIWPAMLMAAGLEVPQQGGHPRLPAAGRAQDVQVAGQRHRALRGRRALRARRAALLPAARGQLRLGRRGLAGGLRDALQHRAGQRVRQPREPDAGHDRPLSRRRGARTATWARRRWTALAAEFEGLPDSVCERLDAVELTPALDEIWRRIKRLNAFVQDEEPWQLAKDEAASERLDQILYGLAEGLRVVSVLLLAFTPVKAEQLLAALGQEDRSLEGARFGAQGGGARIGELGQLFPRVESPEPSAA